jgi:uncharacterized repeat protein (TIGR01451 family)
MTGKLLPATALAVALVLLLTILAAVQSTPGVKAAGSEPETEASARWVIQCVDCPKRFGVRERSLRLDTEGHPHLAYGGDHLYYAWHDGVAWHYETVDSTPRVGGSASLALDADGRPHISYYDGTNEDLKYARWMGSAWDIQIVDSEGVGGSLALDADGRPHISYIRHYDSFNDDELRYARWTGSNWEIQTVDSEASLGGPISLALDGDGQPHISYEWVTYLKSESLAPRRHVRYAHWTASAWDIRTIALYGGSASLALDADGRPHISYLTSDLYGNEPDLQYAHWTGSAWDIQNVDSEGHLGPSSSLALDADGRPHISYPDQSNNALKYARWTGSAWEIQTVDNSLGWMCTRTSLALDAAGQPHISYLDWTNYDLKYAHWTGNAWDIQAVDSGGDVGEFTSLALDADGRPHISYYDDTNDDLKYARWTGSAWDIETVDSEGDVGYSTSLALDADGQPHISYLDWTNDDLKYARWTGSEWDIQTVDSEGDVGYSTSLALDADGRPHISYYDDTNDDLKYARWTGSAWDIETVDNERGTYTSVALDAAGQPHISYHDGYPNNDLKYARWTGSAWDIETVDSEGDVGNWTSLALDADGRPHISYLTSDLYGNEPDLQYAHWTGSAWDIQTVDSGLDWRSASTSLALDADGQPHISYCNDTSDDLKYARWTGSAWDIQTVDSANGYASLALDADGQPHISYYDYGDLKYAYNAPDLSASFKWVEPRRVKAGERISYTLGIVNHGSMSTTFTLDDPVPAHTTYVPGSAWASGGTISDTADIQWTGTVTAGSSLTATFAVTIDGDLSQPTAIVNVATLEGDPSGPLTLRADIIADAYEFYLPLVFYYGP